MTTSKSVATVPPVSIAVIADQLVLWLSLLLTITESDRSAVQQLFDSYGKAMQQMSRRGYGWFGSPVLTLFGLVLIYQ